MTFDSNDRSGVILFYITKHDPIKLLTVVCYGNKRGIPKGHFDPDKDPSLIHCASRELEEETGITDIKLDEKMFCKVDNMIIYITKTKHLYDVNKLLENCQDRNEITEINWITYEDLQKLNNSVINNSLRYIKHSWFKLVQRII